jgi:hypothetical protein
MATEEYRRNGAGVLLPSKRELEHHKRQLQDASDKVLKANALVEVRVIAARRAGLGWRPIAEGLGMAWQSASQRFGKLPEIKEMEGG